MFQRSSTPLEWQRAGLGMEQAISYLTPEESVKLHEETHLLLEPYLDRTDYPDKRPQGSVPIELVRLSYLLRHLTDRKGSAGEGVDVAADGPTGEPPPG